jgi:2'-5' RNA ligase
MVAWVPPRSVREQLAIAGGEEPDELQMTLCFFSDFAALDVAGVAGAMGLVSTVFGPLSGQVSGLGRFSIPDGDALVALIDVSGLGLLREALVWEFRERGIAYADDHGFTPHITLAYLKPGQRRAPLERLEPLPVTVTTLTLSGPDGVVGELLLGGAKEAEASRAPRPFWRRGGF